MLNKKDQRLRRYDQIIGQIVNVNIAMNKLASLTFPNFVICEGEMGSGKSTFAEITAMALTCESGEIEACLECNMCKANMKAMDSTGKSPVITKVNMGLMTKKDDIELLIKELFILEASQNQNVVYILEEFHALRPKELQIPFLEELTRIQKGVYIIICTTNVKSLLDELVSRAKITFKFNKLSSEECITLINRKCDDMNIKMSELDKKFLVNATKHSARDIVHVLENLTDIPNFSKVMREYFSNVPNRYYTDFLSYCHRDFTTFIIYISDLEGEISLVDFWNGMMEFLRNSIYYLYGRGGTLFTNKEKSRVKEVFRGIDEATLQKMLSKSYKRVRELDDAQFHLITFREIFNRPKTVADYKIDAVAENEVAEKNSEEVQQQKKAVSVELITENLLMNISGDGEIYNE